MSETAAAARKRAHEDRSAQDFLRALGVERGGYVQRAAGAAADGDAREYARMVSRIAQVDAQIVARGGAVPDVPVPDAPAASSAPDGTSYPPSRRSRA